MFVLDSRNPIRRGSNRDEWIMPGETFEPTEAERSAFGDVLTRVEPSDDTVAFDPGAYSVSDLETKLASESYTPRECMTLLDAERDGKNRVTAKNAIQDYID